LNSVIRRILGIWLALLVANAIYGVVVQGDIDRLIMKSAVTTLDFGVLALSIWLFPPQLSP
jgi:hypothetical protein